jgi:hypothetical protein
LIEPIPATELQIWLQLHSCAPVALEVRARFVFALGWMYYTIISLAFLRSTAFLFASEVPFIALISLDAASVSCDASNRLLKAVNVGPRSWREERGRHSIVPSPLWLNLVTIEPYIWTLWSQSCGYQGRKSLIKALNLCRNLGRKVRTFTTADMDFVRHYRPQVNVVERPSRSGGRGIILTGHHEIMFPLLVAAVREELRRGT